MPTLALYSVLTNHLLRITWHQYLSNFHEVKMKPHNCHFCNYSTPKTSTLKKHLKQIHFYCPTCRTKATTREKLYEHLKNVHHEAFQCEFCSKMFERKSELKLHLGQKHSKERPEFILQNKNICDVCDFVAAGPKDLENHNDAKHLMRRNYKCRLCDYKGSRQSDVGSHTKTSHGNTDSKAYQCNKCDATIFGVSTRALAAHIIFEHGRATKCEYCDYSSPKFNHLMRHEKTCQEKTKGTLEKCHKCSASFSNTMLLGYHQAKFHGKIAKCDNCDFIAESWSKLRVHIKKCSLNVNAKIKCETKHNQEPKVQLKNCLDLICQTCNHISFSKVLAKSHKNLRHVEKANGHWIVKLKRL